MLLSAAKAAGDTKKRMMIEETTPDVLNAKGLLMFLKQSPSASSAAAETHTGAGASPATRGTAAGEGENDGDCDGATTGDEGGGRRNDVDTPASARVEVFDGATPAAEGVTTAEFLMPPPPSMLVTAATSADCYKAATLAAGRRAAAAHDTATGLVPGVGRKASEERSERASSPSSSSSSAVAGTPQPRSPCRGAAVAPSPASSRPLVTIALAATPWGSSKRAAPVPVTPAATPTTAPRGGRGGLAVPGLPRLFATPHTPAADYSVSRADWATAARYNPAPRFRAPQAIPQTPDTPSAPLTPVELCDQSPQPVAGRDSDGPGEDAAAAAAAIAGMAGSRAPSRFSGGGTAMAGSKEGSDDGRKGVGKRTRVAAM